MRAAVDLNDSDAELVRLACSQAQVRLRIGELLDALFMRHGHHELGFSSIDAYVVERCHRSRRWGRESRSLARRIRERGLESIRQAVRSGHVGWCMAQVLARYATAENVESLIGEAERSTVREMQAKLTGREQPEAEDPIEVTSIRGVSVDEMLMVSASRMLVEYISGARPSDEMLISALLGEAETTLLSLAGARIEQVVLPELDPSAVEAGLEA